MAIFTFHYLFMCHWCILLRASFCPCWIDIDIYWRRLKFQTHSSDSMGLFDRVISFHVSQPRFSALFDLSISVCCSLWNDSAMCIDSFNGGHIYMDEILSVVNVLDRRWSSCDDLAVQIVTQFRMFEIRPYLFEAAAPEIKIARTLRLISIRRRPFRQPDPLQLKLSYHSFLDNTSGPLHPGPCAFRQQTTCSHVSHNRKEIL